ncbi:uncharacterized protein RCC_04487 [Ramularia collo-cygni]|uniref:Uncharacterized protein n=1 Tax=Ramularia collo-cygni TaxID=112498 RepID=A0A2D3VDJ5_9PEZI|nr:uncharacterized protein RCC_04487 [Ramularia collo-cygni]CZT18643.1 uncharacterized protein RCC_04487 [Ramularia collo-cygni]
MLSHEECLRIINAGAVTKPDADISGIGVILAFLISAYVSFAVVLVAYAFGIVEPELLSPTDSKIMRVRSRVHRHPKLHRVLQHTILALSDQQIVTGIAIMAAGFVGLRSGETSVYHYQIVLYLAWLASSVHLSALTILRPFLSTHPAVRAWRLTGMVVLFLMLVVGLIPTVSYDWGIINISEPDDHDVQENETTGWGIPARCFWGRTYGDGVNNDAPIGYILLLVSYIWKIGDMFESTRRLYGLGIRQPLERGTESLLSIPARRYRQTRQKRYLWCFRLLLVPAVPVVAFVEFLRSFSASLWLSLWGLVFGTIQVVVPRQQNLLQTGSKEEEWGFSQLVALILLVQPLGAITEHMWVRDSGDGEHHSYGTKSSDEEERVAADQRLLAGTPEPNLKDSRALIELLGREIAMRGTGASSRATPNITKIVLSSRVGLLLLVLIQITLVGGTCTILYFDAASVGVVRGQNWPYALIALAFYVSSSWLAILITSPFSRLGKDYSLHTMDDLAVHVDVENDLKPLELSRI